MSRTLRAGRIALVVVLSTLVAAAEAQPSAVGWEAYPSFASVAAVASGPGGVWAGVTGGVLRYDPDSGEITRVTSVDGLNGGTLTALAVDPSRGTVWVGFEDGVLNRIDPETGTVSAVFDIERADQYASRSIRRLRFAGDSLLVATDFGLVVYDVARGETRDTYARFASLAAATPVNDALVAPLPDGRPGLWVATEDGLVRAPRMVGTLQVASAWTLDSAFEHPAYSLSRFRGAVYVAGGPDGARDLYQRLPDGSYERRLFIDNRIVEVVALGDRIVGIDGGALRVLFSDGTRAVLRSDAVSRLAAATATPDGTLWAGDLQAGLFSVALPEPGGPPDVTISPQPVAPEGPISNSLVDVAVGTGGAAWVATRRVDGSAAVSRLADGVWTTTTRDEVSALFNGPRSASAGPDGTFYLGSSGEGLIVFGPDGTVTPYERDNSTLRGVNTAPEFVVVPDVGFEGDRRWVLNLGAATPMHLFRADGTWAGLPYPRQIPSSDQAIRIAVDDFGRKWLALFRTGIAVWDTGADPADPADDSARRFASLGSNGQGLPDNDVRDVVVDLDGAVWIGTARGIAFVFSPGSALDGPLSISWPIIEGTETQQADYLLRDVAVNDLEVDPAGRLWVATTTGAYLVNRARNDLVLAFDADNSPLPSDDVLAVSVDPETGRVYFATRQGLVAFQSDATAARPGSSELAVSPNPFRPSQGDASVLIEGLAATESDVRIVTVAGDVVYSQSVTGGAFRWDGRDGRTREPVSSGVYLVVAAGVGGGGRVVGKIAVVR